MKKIICVLASLAVLGGANVFAKGLGLGSLSKNLTGITGGGKASEGTIPEGRDILPAIWQAAQPTDDGDQSKILDSAIWLSGADVGNGTYEITQYFLLKAMIGTTEQDSKVSVKVDGSKFTVETTLLENVSDGGNGEHIQGSSSGMTQLAKAFCNSISDTLKLSDDEYAEIGKKAYADLYVINSVVATSTNVLKSKLWLKQHPAEGAETKAQIKITAVDLSKLDGYSYRVDGISQMGNGGGKGNKYHTIRVYFYTNNDAVIDWKAGDVKTVSGKISSINYSFPDSVSKAAGFNDGITDFNGVSSVNITE